ncbi:MAG: ATP-binding protein [Patescibacteria group bacterium]|jgi:signal transduction histidine kinase
MLKSLSLPIIIVGVLSLAGFLFFFLQKVLKLRKLKGLSPESPSLNVEFLDLVIEKIGESLELSRVLDVVLKKFETKVLYSVASYVIKVSDKKVIFKSLVRPQVSKQLLAEAKTRLFSEMEKTANVPPFSYEVEEDVIGGPLSEGKPDPIGSYLLFPLYRKQEIVGCISFITNQKGVYGDSAKTYVSMALTEMMAIYDRLVDLVDRETEKFEGIVNNMREGVLVVDKNLQVLVENPAVTKIVGLSNLVSPNFLDLADYFSSSFSLENEVAQVFNSGMPKKVSEVEKDGKSFELLLLPIINNTVVIRVGIIIYDQTEEKELEKLRREFSAMVIHELRSPLSVIRGTAEVILSHEDEVSAEDKHKFLDQIRLSSIALLDKVGELLDAAKIEEKKIEVFRNFADINDLLRQTKEFFSNLAAQKNVTLSVDLDESLIQFYIDSKKILQVLNNLVSNAVKFTPEGGEIVLKSSNKGELVEVSVTDTGEGVSDELKPKLFDKYVRGKNTNEHGTGLGLVIAKGIVEAHNGKIWIEDNQPKGAKFIFSIPKQNG